MPSTKSILTCAAITVAVLVVLKSTGLESKLDLSGLLGKR